MTGSATQERGEAGGARAASPLVSVVTVAFDAARTLPACLESVASQTHPGVEHLVVDGGSTDGTLDVLRAWDQRLAWWVSEPDRGIYDAMNKGIAQARGEWLYFLGADDVLASPEVIERCVPHLTAGDGAAVVYGDVRFSTGAIFHSRVSRELLVGNTVHHQGAFYASRIFRERRYDTSLRLLADYDLNLGLYLAGEAFVRADVTVARCAEGGSSRARLLQAFREASAVRRRHMGWLASAPRSALLAAKFALDVIARARAAHR